METHFGFLLQSGTFVTDLPDDIAPVFEQAASAGRNPAFPVAIQCAPRSRVDFHDFGWRHTFNVNAEGRTIGVCTSVTDAEVVIPVWDLGSHVVWMQLRGKTSAARNDALSSFVSGISPYLDASGVPRVKLNNGFEVGSPLTEPANRNHVLFSVPSSIRMIVFRYDGALGADKVTSDGSFALVTVTTPFGISVHCDGPLAMKGELVSSAHHIAGSVRKLN
jgi:hypothetical protein